MPEEPEINESIRVLPAPALRPWVASYAGYRQVGPPARHRGLPSPYLTVILTLDDPLVVERHPDAGQPGDRYDALIGGLHLTSALIVHDGRQSGIQLDVHPFGARALFGLPAAELSGLDVPADAVLGADAGRLRERILTAGSWSERFAALDAGLVELAQRRRVAAPSAAVTAAWELMVTSVGRLAVDDVARHAGWGARQLRTRLRAEVGLGPKEAIRVIRFDRARRRLATDVRSEKADLAVLAAECGYYDQAHLTREFNQLAGCPPGRWLAEELRNIQSGAHEPVPA